MNTSGGLGLEIARQGHALQTGASAIARFTGTAIPFVGAGLSIASGILDWESYKQARNACMAGSQVMAKESRLRYFLWAAPGESPLRTFLWGLAIIAMASPVIPLCDCLGRPNFIFARLDCSDCIGGSHQGVWEDAYAMVVLGDDDSNCRCPCSVHSASALAQVGSIRNPDWLRSSGPPDYWFRSICRREAYGKGGPREREL